MFFLPDKKKIITLFTWGLASGLGFILFYGGSNFLAGTNPVRFNFWFDWESKTPFIKEFIWLYLSLNIALILPIFTGSAFKLKRYYQTNIVTLIIGSVFFLLYPSQLGFSRIVPSDPLYSSIYSFLFYLDHPHNLVPSLHVTYSTLAIYCVIEQNPEKPALTFIFLCWLILIALSVVFVHQHHLIDVATGFLLAYLGIRFVYNRG